jgi:pimeloyl-ACP methyl ester carboxylesterase
MSARRKFTAIGAGLAIGIAVLCVGEPVLDAGAVADDRPQLPGQIADVLARFGVLPPDADGLPFGDWKGALQVPVTDPEIVELMGRARREDVVLPLSHELFGPRTAQIAHWHSDFFLSNYGTALFLAAPFVEGRIPVVLVAGMNGSARDFTDLLAHLDRGRYQVLYFVYPSGMPLPDAARQLGVRLEELTQRHNVERFAVIAHSMGGLVAKGVLDQFDVGRSLASWRLLISISSPFAGIELAQYAERLPSHPPAWDDLAGHSPFLQKVQGTGFPRTLSFYLLFSARSSRGPLAALGNNDGVITVDSMVGTPVSQSARDVFGFYEDHNSILTAPRVFHRLDQILDGELGG